MKSSELKIGRLYYSNYFIALYGLDDIRFHVKISPGSPFMLVATNPTMAGSIYELRALYKDSVYYANIDPSELHEWDGTLI